MDRATRLGLAGPESRRETSGSTATTSSAEAIALNRPSATWPAQAAGQAAHAAAAAAAAARSRRPGASSHAPPGRGRHLRQLAHRDHPHPTLVRLVPADGATQVTLHR
jgi:hypothetical protein